MPKMSEAVKWDAEKVFKLKQALPYGFVDDLANALNMKRYQVNYEFRVNKKADSYNALLLNKAVAMLAERGITLDFLK